MWVLASASPRRKDLLRQCGADFIIDPSRYEEENVQEEPARLTMRQAAGKANETAARRADGLPVLGADTIVVCDGEILGKPGDRAEAERMLSLLSGRAHEVWTGIALVANGEVVTKAVRTVVHMREIYEAEKEYYLAGTEWTDKAGAYGIQGYAALFVTAIEGSYSNVVGLPLAETAELLRARGVAW